MIRAKELVLHFESLGDNCEFGLLQRRCGSEPLGFFRWNWTTLDSLLSVLDDGFEHVGGAAEIEVFTNPANGELMVRMPRYSFSYHTHKFEETTAIDELRAQQLKVQEFLKRKTLEDLRSAGKIYVRKGNDTQFLADAERLHAALRRYGPNTLLWVVPEDESHPRGTVEMVSDGLLKGYIDRLAPYTTSVDLSPFWVDVCRHAYGLWQGDYLAGTTIGRHVSASATNLLRRDYIENALGWSGPWTSPAASSEVSDFAGPGEARWSRVNEHRLIEETTPRSPAIFGYAIPHGLSPGTVYVASTFIYIPADADIEAVAVVVAGYSSLRIVRADATTRGRWQRIATAAQVPTDLMRAIPSLHIVGRAGARVYSAGWQMEIGWDPKPYAASNAGGLPMYQPGSEE